MNDTITLTGLVIGTMPMGEYDKRLLILTAGRGKISAFAKGSRKPSSALVGAARLFSFGSFELYEGRSSYTVRSAQIREHFDFLSTDMERMCYASYFSELCDYYGRENEDCSAMLKLMYVALMALKRPELPLSLVRAVFELKLMAIEGEYYEVPRTATGPAAAYAWQYVLESRPERLFSFTLAEDALGQFIAAVEDQTKAFLDRSFRSLEILKEL